MTLRDRLFAAFRLRCPGCGKGRIMRSWLVMNRVCPECHQAPDRGESDYFLGAMMFNLGFSEIVFGAAFLTMIALFWPVENWTVVMWSGVAVMIAAPFVCYPFAKGVWLAIDLHFRPDVDQATGVRGEVQR